MATSGENTWRIGDIIDMGGASDVEPWPERTAGEAVWFVAHTMAGMERHLAAEITALGFSAYVPLRRVLTRRPPRRKAVKVDYPLFARYVFFEIVPNPRAWTAVRGLRDLVGILANQEAPVRVTDETIGDIMAAEDMQLFDETVGPNAVEILKGDRVSIVAGTWHGYEAIVQSPAGRRASLRIVGSKGSRDVTVPLDLLRILA
jgi:transcription antitermination factor NusG